MRNTYTKPEHLQTCLHTFLTPRKKKLQYSFKLYRGTTPRVPLKKKKKKNRDANHKALDIGEKKKNYLVQDCTVKASSTPTTKNGNGRNLGVIASIFFLNHKTPYGARAMLKYINHPLPPPKKNYQPTLFQQHPTQVDPAPPRRPPSSARPYLAFQCVPLRVTRCLCSRLH